MKYFFVLDDEEKRHIIVAKNVDNAVSLCTDNNIVADEIYELTEDIYHDEGFLLSDQ